MPEYLSPGVFIEEVPSGLKAIEGVSTSTAGFVGRARRGTVPGYVWPGSGTPNLPFTPTGGFVLTPDPAPVLVTSFAEFQRQFGRPLPIPMPGDPSDYGYLAWAVRAFFDNGGRRAYIVRIVDGTDTPSTIQASQGVIYRLLRSAATGDGTGLKPLHFTSTRGLTVGDTITFRRLSDGTTALGKAAAPAIAVGMAGPFSLKDGDQLDVTTSLPALVTVSGVVAADPAEVQTSGAAPFAVPNGATLQVRIGPASEPVQTVVFSAADPLAPITPGAATLAQVEAVLQRYVSGVKVFQSGGQVVMESDVQGTAARIEIVAGTAVAPLGMVTGVTGPPPGGNVPDAGHVTVADLSAMFAAMFPGADFTVTADTAGLLQFTSTVPGAGATIKLDEVPAGSGLLQRLGFGAVSTLTRTGAAAVPSTVSVAAYDVQSNSVTLTAPLPGALGAGDVYGVVTVPTPGTGPKFFARSPGSWSADVSVSILSADRSPTAVTAPAASGATKLQVQSVASLYVGAVIEVDHNGAGRSIHQVMEINAATRIITIDAGLPLPALTVPGAFVRTLEIDVVVNDATGSAPTEVYRGLSWNQAGNADLRRHYAWSINARSRLVWVQPPAAANEGPALTRQPVTPDGFPMKPAPADVGTDGFVDNSATWIGDDLGPGARSGIQAFEDLTEVRIIAAPGKTRAGHPARADRAVRAAALPLRDPRRRAGSRGRIDHVDPDAPQPLRHVVRRLLHAVGRRSPWTGRTGTCRRPAISPASTPGSTTTRGVWKAPANEPVRNVTGAQDQLHHRRAGPAEPARREPDPALRRAAASASGARARCRAIPTSSTSTSAAP